MAFFFLASILSLLWFVKSSSKFRASVRCTNWKSWNTKFKLFFCFSEKVNQQMTNSMHKIQILRGTITGRWLSLVCFQNINMHKFDPKNELPREEKKKFYSLVLIRFTHLFLFNIFFMLLPKHFEHKKWYITFTGL